MKNEKLKIEIKEPPWQHRHQTAWKRRKHAQPLARGALPLLHFSFFTFHFDF
jgi:hypothetical protein